MSRLKHPVRAIREPFGKAGLIVAIVALVAAFTTGAFAASGGSPLASSSSKSKAKAGPRGPRGKAGPAGPAGAAGPAGPVGPAGPAGAKGDTGATGPAGSTGATGSEGSPWTAGGVLPPGETETGAWSLPQAEEEESPAFNHVWIPISFTLPLPEKECEGEAGFGLCPDQLHWINEEDEEVVPGEGTVAPTACLGTAKNPTAQPGNLCVYAAESGFTGFYLGYVGYESIGITNPTTLQGPGVATSGALIELLVKPSAGSYRAMGTYAVTAAG